MIDVTERLFIQLPHPMMGTSTQLETVMLTMMTFLLEETAKLTMVYTQVK